MLRIALTAEATAWRVEVTQADQAEGFTVPWVLVQGLRLPAAAGALPADAARALSPATATEALAAGRRLFELFVPAAFTPTDEVVIEAAADDSALHLPWNLLADAQGHLIRRLALRREIRRSEDSPVVSISSVVVPQPLRVLFVVAVGTHEVEVAAGAEYLGLLRRLDAAGLLLEHTVRITPTRAELEAAITHFQPAVLHWIGHGTARSGALPSLRLDSDRDHPELSAAALATLCAGVPVVVLNTCHSAGTGDATVPLAAELVRRGVPVVVGMQGRVKDRACRLFSWQLYQALALGQPLARAVAAGQRAGLDEPGLEWARPALFVARGTTLTLDATHRPAAEQAVEVRRQFQPRRAYFCGRFGVLAALPDLLGPAGGRTTALLVRLNPRDLPDRRQDKVGLTWLLDELGGHLAAAGRVPVELLFPDLGVEVPVDWPALARALSGAVRKSRKALGLDGRGEALRAFSEEAKAVDPMDFMDDFLEALQKDLAALAHEAGRDPVLLIDDLHRLGPLGSALLRDGLGRFGLGTSAVPVPLVAVFVEREEPEYAGAVGALRTFAEAAPQAVRVVSLGPFTGDEERLAYQQFLVGQTTPLVLSGQDDLKAHQLLQYAIKGVPSRLPVAGPDAVALLKSWGFVQVADDEALLKGLRP